VLKRTFVYEGVSDEEAVHSGRRAGGRS